MAQLEKENGQLKAKISNFVSDSQDIQPAASTQGKTKVPQSPMVPSIKMSGRLSLKSPVISMSNSPSFKQQRPFTEALRQPNFDAAQQYGGHMPMQPYPMHTQPPASEPPQTPLSEMWAAPFRQQHPVVTSFNPMNHVTPGRFLNYPLQQSQQHGPPPNGPPYGYGQHTQQPAYQPPSTFGSPRPFYRNGHPANPGHAPHASHAPSGFY